MSSRGRGPYTRPYLGIGMGTGKRPRIKRERSSSREPSDNSFLRRSRLYRISNSPNTIYKFKRTVLVPFNVNPGGTNPGLSPTAPTSGGPSWGFGIGMTFTLSEVYVLGSGSGGTSSIYAMPNVAEFQSLFDSYRIKRVDLRMLWDQTGANLDSTGTLGNTSVVYFNICNDDDDGQPPATPTELLQRPETRLIALGAGNRSLIQTHSVYPKVLTSAQSDAGASQWAVTVPRSTWIDMAASPAHYGVKMNWDSLLPTANINLGRILMYVDYYMEFKGVR